MPFLYFSSREEATEFIEKSLETNPTFQLSLYHEEQHLQLFSPPYTETECSTPEVRSPARKWWEFWKASNT